VNNLKLKKVPPTRLREVGLGEVWLQEQIAKDPSILGLGELHVIQREKVQPAGGRIDFLMSDLEAETRYEIEIMLGAVDESHIIRTIEYWDVERQRYPTLEHRAVIVAEEITARFFNVIRLLNRAIPIIAIQLSAFVMDDSIVLHFTRVLDTYEFGAEPGDDEPPGEPADRAYWEKRATRESLGVVDAFMSLIPTARGAPRVTYNRGHIALGTSGYNFCWLHPRRASPHCHLHVKVPPDQRPALLESLEATGIDAANRGRTSIRLRLSAKEINEHRAPLEELMRVAEEFSQR
jgi:hypothetical protein